MRDICQGDVWFVEAAPVPGGGSIGNEMWSGRPGVVVSNDTINKRSGVVQIVYLTSSKRRHTNATHVPVCANNQQSIAVCNQVTNIDTSRLTNYIGHITGHELQEIQNGIAFTLGLGGAKPGAALHKWEQQLDAHSIDLYEQELSLNDKVEPDVRVEGLKEMVLRVTKERDALRAAITANEQNAAMYQKLKEIFNTSDSHQLS